MKVWYSNSKKYIFFSDGQNIDIGQLWDMLKGDDPGQVTKVLTVVQYMQSITNGSFRHPMIWDKAMKALAKETNWDMEFQHLGLKYMPDVNISVGHNKSVTWQNKRFVKLYFEKDRLNEAVQMTGAVKCHLEAFGIMYHSQISKRLQGEPFPWMKDVLEVVKSQEIADELERELITTYVSAVAAIQNNIFIDFSKLFELRNKINLEIENITSLFSTVKIRTLKQGIIYRLNSGISTDLGLTIMEQTTPTESLKETFVPDENPEVDPGVSLLPLPEEPVANSRIAKTLEKPHVRKWTNWTDEELKVLQEVKNIPDITIKTKHKIFTEHGFKHNYEAFRRKYNRI